MQPHNSTTQPARNACFLCGEPNAYKMFITGVCLCDDAQACRSRMVERYLEVPTFARREIAVR